MALLNTADALYLGDQAVSRVYLGDVQVWPGVTPPAGLSWAGGFRMDLAGTVATSSDTGTGHAYSDPLPAGLVYLELEADVNLGDNRGGLWCADDPSDEGPWLPLGQFASQPSMGGAGDDQWWWAVYANGDYVHGDSPNNDLHPAIRWGVAYNGSTRSAWMRQVWPTGAGDWFAASMPADPATGSNPSAVFGGTGAPRVGASAADGASITIIAPGDHYAAPPAGFTAI